MKKTILFISLCSLEGRADLRGWLKTTYDQTKQAATKAKDAVISSAKAAAETVYQGAKKTVKDVQGAFTDK